MKLDIDGSFELAVQLSICRHIHLEQGRTLKSFFGAIQHWFSGDLYGRHLGLILQEIGVRQPKALTSFISDACGIPHKNLKNVRFQAEYTFQGKRGKRRADLAVLLEDEDEPIVLIEIKYHDKPLPETETKPAQLDDYRTWRDAEKERRHVLLLSRELYASPGLEVRRWNVLARHLRPYAERSDLVDMLVKYLEEEGNVMQDINGASLTKYIKRYLCHRKQGANNVDGPVEFSNLLKNIRLMSGTFHGHFKGAWRDAGMKIEGESYDKTSKVASIDFDVWNRLKAGADGKAIVDADGGLRNELKDGGTIDVYAKHSFGHAQNWLRVGYGITFVVSSEDNMDTPPEAFLFASVHGAAFERAGITILLQKKINFRWVTEDAERRSDKIEEILSKLICGCVEKALNENLPLLPQQKKALGFVKKSLAAGHQALLEAA